MGDSLLDGAGAALAWFSDERSGVMPFLTLLTLIALVLQIHGATKNTKREKAVDIFQRCLEEFESLLNLRLTISQQVNKPRANAQRISYYFHRYWDLFNTEYEYAKYDLIPRSLFAHFCIRLWHAFQLQSVEGRVGGISLTEGWDQYGRPVHIVLSPRFCEMVDRIRSAADEQEVRALLPQYLKKNRRDDIFGSFG